VGVGARNIPISPLILGIERVKPSWTLRLLPATTAELDQYQPNWQTDIGYPDRYTLDYSDDYLTLNRETSAAGTIRLSTRRMPINPAADIPEIPVKYLEYLYDYMLFRAFRKQDSEVYNPQKADAHLALFHGGDEINPGGHVGRVLKEKSGLLPQQRAVRTF
jgi:hypothetical protein